MIVWNPDLVAFHVGSLVIRWYSLFWTIGLAAAYVMVWRLYREQRIPQDKFDPLFIYCFLGILIGARLGHCLLYEPAYFLSHPLEMLLPMHQDGLGFARRYGRLDARPLALRAQHQGSAITRVG